MSAAAEADVIVVGAGPAGLLLAALLHRRGAAVVLLERRTDRAPGTRAIGVHAPALAALESSGATDQILARAVRVPRGIARTRARVLGEVRFDRMSSRFPFVATVPQAVTEAAVSADGPEPLTGVEVLSVTEVGDRVVVATRSAAGDGEMSCRAVVVAAGASGRDLVASRFGARARSFADRYLMTDIADASGQPQGLAVITLEAAGVLESFPLPGGGRRLVAWVGGSGSMGEAGPEHESEQLRRAVAMRAGDERLAEQIVNASAFGIRRVLLRRMRVGRVIAIGDAAHEVSPIGGQGMNLGLLDAATLAPVLADWLRAPETTAGLDRWEQHRLASAGTAARLAYLNTAMGRARPPRAHGMMTRMLGAGLSGPLARVAARAYAMGLDRDAASQDNASRDDSGRDDSGRDTAPTR